MGEEAPVRALVLFDAVQGELALDQSHGATVEERRDDGSVVLAFEVTSAAAFRSFVLGFLDHAEILEPAELRADMRSYLETMVGA
jgi:predicted DNA-binding transcriptional regulator YafY